MMIATVIQVNHAKVDIQWLEYAKVQAAIHEEDQGPIPICPPWLCSYCFVTAAAAVADGISGDFASLAVIKHLTAKES